MGTPVYVVVHGDVILEFKGRVDGSDLQKINELERVLREEQSFRINRHDDVFSIPRDLPNGREVRVCGGLRGLCVSIQLRHLLKAGYDASIYEPATI